MKSVKWIFFDLGDTLVDESKPIQDSIQQFVRASSSLGYLFEEEEVRSELIRSYCELRAFPMREVMTRLIPSEDHCLTIRQNMKYQKDKEHPFPEAESIVRYLADCYQLGVIANQSSGTAERLETYGLLSYFKVICSSAEIGLSKPDTRIFERALEDAGCLPEEALMVGDRIDNDIVPAKKLGMKAIWIRQGLAKHQPIPVVPFAPDAVIDQLDEMMRLF